MTRPNLELDGTIFWFPIKGFNTTPIVSLRWLSDLACVGREERGFKQGKRKTSVSNELCGAHYLLRARRVTKVPAPSQLTGGTCPKGHCNNPLRLGLFHSYCSKRLTRTGYHKLTPGFLCKCRLYDLVLQVVRAVRTTALSSECEFIVLSAFAQSTCHLSLNVLEQLQAAPRTTENVQRCIQSRYP